MTEPGPTILIAPAPIEPLASGAMAPGPFLLGAGALLCLLVGLIVRRWGRGTDAHERAFRRLVRAMGLSRAQAARVRRYARSASIVAPVGVLMNETLLREALEPGKV